MIRQNTPSAYYSLFLWCILGLDSRVCSSDEVPCPLSILIPFHDDRVIDSSTIISIDDNRRDGLGLLASALLAINDFNSRESILAPDALKGIQDSCAIYFPPPIITDSRQSATAVKSAESSWIPAENSTCSYVIGPYNNLVAEVVGQTVKANGTIAISYGANADELADDSSTYPNLALGNIKWEDYVRSLLQYVRWSGWSDVGVLLTPEDNLDFNNTDFVPMWTNASEEIGVEIESLSRIAYRSKSVLEERLQNLRDTRGVRTILVTLHRDDELEVLAEVADELGMLTEEYTWIMTEHFLSSRYVESYHVSTSSPIVKLFQRTEIFEMLDGFSPFVVNNEVNASELLRTDLLSQGAMLLESMQSIMNETGAFDGLVVDQTVLEEAFFLNAPANGASLLYDTILAAGLSACSGEVDMESLLETEFDGVSGKFAFRTDSRSLSASETQFGVFSISVTTDSSSGRRNRRNSAMATFKTKLIHRMVGGLVDLKPAVGDFHTLSFGARLYGLILGGLAILCSVICGIFVYKFRNDRIVKIGQPEFLGLVCAGAFLVAIPVVLRPFDEGSGLSSLSLSVSCTSQMWLKYLGILIVNMALFSKLYRVEKVTQMRRRQRIQVKDVIKPFCGLFGTAFVLLIVWTAVDAPVWKTESGIGFCDEALYFGVAMDILMIIAISLTLWWAEKTSNLPEDISDSMRVYFTLVAQFIILMMDILLSVFTRAVEDNNFAYVVEATFSGALSFTCVVYLIGPKMYWVHHKEKTGELPPSLQRGTVTVTGIAVPTGTAGGITGASRYKSNRASSRALRASNHSHHLRSSASVHFPSIISEGPSSFTRSSAEHSPMECSPGPPAAPHQIQSPRPRSSVDMAGLYSISSGELESGLESDTDDQQQEK
ncbi:unnamed protein product [Cylindrotheca closterium]|uniref:G-protein coupled receptors family 3 profile domain-containing protein n=1 Tax=Cylindrotheca closterium TaxID=2856 RepID=A0AAD2FR61_9STRA|nr:unnamed protein product [Cylindrotheca closterium]